jgi:hypothetical protein
MPDADTAVAGLNETVTDTTGLAADAAASAPAGPHRAVVLAFVNQRVTVGDRWLISGFQPV